jgi:type III restriction enzyme
MKNIIEYQTKAIETLSNIIINKINDINETKNMQNKQLSKKQLDNLKKEYIYLISPTGSGKTYMSFETIKSISKENTNTFFLWIAPQKLHTQTYKKFLEYNNEKNFLNPKEVVEDLQIKDILCLNWSKIDKEKNNLIKENENGNIFDKIEKLRKKIDNLTIITFIDEGHIGGEKSQEFLKKLSSDITISVSATPKKIKFDDKNKEITVFEDFNFLDYSNEEIKNVGNGIQVYNDSIIKVNIEEVINAQIIKKEIVLNAINDEIIESEKDCDFLVVESIKKLNYLKRLYEKYNINPLLVIQMENLSDDKKEEIVKDLKKLGIKDEEISTYYSDEKDESFKTIENNSSLIRILFAKIGIATGWDCPRASILLTYRGSKNNSFKIQVLGRISRMPELKHYDEEDLNIAYVYSNITDYIPEEVPSIPILKEKNKTQIKEEYKDIINGKKIPMFIGLKEEYKEKKDLKENKIINILNDSFKELNINTKKEDKQILSGKIENIDNYNIKEQSKITYNYKMEELNIIFKKHSHYIKEVCSEKLFYETFTKYYNIDGIVEIQRILVLNNIENIFKTIKENFLKEINAANGLNINDDYFFEKFNSMDFIFEEAIEIDKTENKLSKHIYDKIGTLNKLELAFCKHLDNKENVICYYNNNYNKNAFKIPYIKDKQINYFFPDFIVWYKHTENNEIKIGIYDTKSILTSSEDIVKEKSESLYNYYKNNITNGDGGLVISNDDNQSFLINRNNKKYVSYSQDKNLNNWEAF